MKYEVQWNLLFDFSLVVVLQKMPPIDRPVLRGVANSQKKLYNEHTRHGKALMSFCNPSQK